jgi:hypothetical protein
MMSLPPEMTTGDPGVDVLEVTGIVQAVQTANGWFSTQALEAEK